MIRCDDHCPYCGQIPEELFEDVQEEDWTIVRRKKHDDDVSCLRGCDQHMKIKFDSECEHCHGHLRVYAFYIQPCNANGYTVERHIDKAEQRELAKQN